MIDSNLPTPRNYVAMTRAYIQRAFSAALAEKIAGETCKIYPHTFRIKPSTVNWNACTLQEIHTWIEATRAFTQTHGLEVILAPRKLPDGTLVIDMPNAITVPSLDAHIALLDANTNVAPEVKMYHIVTRMAERIAENFGVEKVTKKMVNSLLTLVENERGEANLEIAIAIAKYVAETGNTIIEPRRLHVPGLCRMYLTHTVLSLASELCGSTVTTTATKRALRVAYLDPDHLAAKGRSQDVIVEDLWYPSAPYAPYSVMLVTRKEVFDTLEPRTATIALYTPQRSDIAFALSCPLFQQASQRLLFDDMSTTSFERLNELREIYPELKSVGMSEADYMALEKFGLVHDRQDKERIYACSEDYAKAQAASLSRLTPDEMAAYVLCASTGASRVIPSEMVPL